MEDERKGTINDRDLQFFEFMAATKEWMKNVIFSIDGLRASIKELQDGTISRIAKIELEKVEQKEFDEFKKSDFDNLKKDALERKEYLEFKTEMVEFKKGVIKELSRLRKFYWVTLCTSTVLVGGITGAISLLVYHITNPTK